MKYSSSEGIDLAQFDYQSAHCRTKHVDIIVDFLCLGFILERVLQLNIIPKVQLSAIYRVILT